MLTTFLQDFLEGLHLLTIYSDMYIRSTSCHFFAKSLIKDIMDSMKKGKFNLFSTMKEYNWFLVMLLFKAKKGDGIHSCLHAARSV